MASIYLSVVAVLFIFALIQLNESVDVSKLRSVRSVNSLARNTNCEPGKRIGCADCSSVQVCLKDGTGIESSKYRCDSINASQPYCNGNSGICSDQPEGDCDKPSELCPAEGIYPNPTNCREYIYCVGGGKAYVVSCAPSEVYNHTSQNCVRATTPNSCFQLNCSAAPAQNQWFVYTPAPKLYVFCSSSAGPMTFECSGSDSFNPRTRKCEFVCRGQGRFPVEGKDNSFYQCTLGANNVLSYTIQVCPGNLIFDEEHSRCSPRPPATSTSQNTPENQNDA
ncbi:uncharacterized protein LOC131438941 [Malaya genurostris]|uniref:uncharacterized protein LOC131438941 n=1 Tax=Malaya genurostris TaxID=325434 RepID=UPI0026F3BB29|nr:uncharacterized protein LOC131438941 [Malaya genurostris]